MAIRLGDVVVCGELFNTRKNCVHGYLGFRGFPRSLVFELTGNPSPDLAGKHIRFKVRGLPEDEAESGDSEGSDDSARSEKAWLKETGLPRFIWRQIGPTGTITAARQVRVSDCPPKEFYLRCKLDEPPPTIWKPCLTIEWYGQNGRMLVEMVDPEIEFVEDEEETDSTAAASDTGGADDPRNAEASADVSDVAAGPQDEIEDSGNFGLPAESGEDDEDGNPFGSCDDSCEECDESWNPISKDLQRELDEKSRELDRAVRGDTDEEDIIHELELMDDLIENGEGEPVGMLFDEVVRLPSPDSLDETKAEETVKVLLAKMALYGVALDMCEHYTFKDAYRLLVEHISKENEVFRELRGTGWVTHFSTWEYCQQCEEKFKREYESRYGPEDGSSEAKGDGSDDDDGMPF